jgi:hypothetical protein
MTMIEKKGHDMNRMLDYMIRVAKQDVRIFFAPFVGAYRAVKKEANRPPVPWDKSSKSK